LIFIPLVKVIRPSLLTVSWRECSVCLCVRATRMPNRQLYAARSPVANHEVRLSRLSTV